MHILDAAQLLPESASPMFGLSLNMIKQKIGNGLYYNELS